MVRPPPAIPRSHHTILIRWRLESRLNQLRTLRNQAWPRLLPLALMAAFLAFYGVLWLQSCAAQLATLPPAIVTSAAATACFLLGFLAGITGTARDRAAITTPFLVIQPWSPAQRRTARLASAATRLATGLTLTSLTLLLTRTIDRTMLAPAPGALLYAAAFCIGCLPHAHHATPRRPIPQRQKIPTGLVRFDRAAPRWAGWWSLAPRIKSAAWLSLAALIASLSIAAAASTGAHPVTLAPGLAVAGAFLTMSLTLRCAPLVSPILRTSPIPYSRACLAMLRLPALLAFTWFALFTTLASLFSLISPPLALESGAIALLLSLGYAMSALSIPTAPRLALTCYAIALILTADQYAQAQNLAFVILFAILSFLIIFARARFRGRR